jgi:amino acid transporter
VEHPRLYGGGVGVGAARADHVRLGRTAYAVSRDEILPGSAQWKQVSERTHTPVKAVWLAVGLSLLLGVPALVSTVVFNAVASINVIGVFSAYGIPIFYRARQGQTFQHGEGWNLGRHGHLVAWVAVAWIACMDVLFVLPESSPITRSTFNFAGPVLILVLVISAVWWRVSGRRNYQGPVRTISAEDAQALTMEMI